MNNNELLTTYEKADELLMKTDPALRREFVNLMLVCWDLSREGLGYVLGRLVEKYNNVSTEGGILR